MKMSTFERREEGEASGLNLKRFTKGSFHDEGVSEVGVAGVAGIMTGDGNSERHCGLAGTEKVSNSGIGSDMDLSGRAIELGAIRFPHIKRCALTVGLMGDIVTISALDSDGLLLSMVFSLDSGIRP